MDAYSLGHVIGSLIIFPGIPILLVSLFLNRQSKKRLEKAREQRANERLERHNRKPME